MLAYRGFADLIRRQRKEKRMTLLDVAEAVEWSVPYVSELERGIKQPPADHDSLGRLARALGLDRAELISEAMLSRRTVELDLDGSGVTQRQLAVMLARRFERGLTDEQIESIIDLFGGWDSVVDEIQGPF